MSSVETLGRLWHLSRDKRALLVESMACLAAARLAVLVIPFRRMAPRLGATKPESSTDDSKALLTELDRIKWALRSAGGRLPWRCECLEQGLAAKMMLRRRRIPHTLYLGVRRDGGDLKAHAWVRSGTRIVTGGSGVGFTVVAHYADVERSP